MVDLHSVIKRPLLTEKSNVLKGDNNQVVFEVAIKADKYDIREAVEKLFEVKVDKVSTIIVHGKVKTQGKSRGRKSNWKKAVVTLKEGHNLELFEGV